MQQPTFAPPPLLITSNRISNRNERRRRDESSFLYFVFEEEIYREKKKRKKRIVENCHNRVDEVLEISFHHRPSVVVTCSIHLSIDLCEISISLWDARGVPLIIPRVKIEAPARKGDTGDWTDGRAYTGPAT